MTETESETEFVRLSEEKLRRHHITLLEAISNQAARYNNKQLARILGNSESTVSEHLDNLTQSGYIEKKTDGINNYYELRRRGENVLRSVGDDFELDDRGHDVLYTFPIHRTTKEGFDETEFLVNKDMSGWGKQLTRQEESEVVVQINAGSSVTILVREVWANSPEAAAMFSYVVAERAVLHLIEDNSGLVVGTDGSGSVSPCRVSRQSHAITNETFAEVCAEFNISFSGAETEGRFEVDQSHGTPEIEFVHPDYAQQDFKRYKQLILGVLKGNISLTALRWLSENLEKLKKLTALDVESLEEDYGGQTV